MQNRIRSYVRWVLALTAVLLLGGGPSGLWAQSWQRDVLPGFEQQTLVLKTDYAGPEVATLVRKLRSEPTRQAVLYVHGYNDYFFQTALADSLNQHGYNFYAVDLRRYGRSLREGQDAFSVRDLSEYNEELDAALSTMLREGNTTIYMLAHSTGGLITSLYLEETKNKYGVQGLILNSPFLDFNFSPRQEKLIHRLAPLGKLLPQMVVARPSREVDAYAQSLLKDWHGRWEYNGEWKKAKGHPIRLSWVRAIRRGHQRLQRGLHLEMPILVMSSDKSLHGTSTWREEYGRADLVLDVDDIQHYGAGLGRQVEQVCIPGGLHDLFLSSDPAAYEAAYRALFSFLDRHNPTSR